MPYQDFNRRKHSDIASIKSGGAVLLCDVYCQSMCLCVLASKTCLGMMYCHLVSCLINAWVAGNESSAVWDLMGE